MPAALRRRAGREQVRVLVNEAFVPQRVTGQQRYATEIASRLAGAEAFGRARPAGRWASSTLRTWAWVQLVLPLVARSAVVLSMTSRAPLWRRRHVLVIHDLFVLTNPEWFSRLYVLTHAPLLRLQIRSAAAVVAVSQPVADQLADLRPEPVPVAPNAPSDVFRVSGPDDDVLVRHGLKPGSYFLTVGSRDPRKNLARVVAAYSRLTPSERAEHPLVVVGGSAGIYRGETVTWPAEAVIAGYVPDHQLRGLYRGARTVVFASLAEGFGLPLVEAAAAGAPSLLVSDIAVFRWVCGDAARYVDPHSTESITAGLLAEIDAPRNKEIDSERFSWDASAAVIREVCTATAGGA